MEKLLVANLLQGLVALAWLAGIRRFAGPLAPALWADLLRFCLGLPVVLLVLFALGLPAPPAALHSLRVDRWTAALNEASPLIQWLLLALLVGTAGLFAVQEVRPAWGLWRERRGPALAADPDLQRETDELLSLMRSAGLAPSRGRTPLARRLESEDLTAGLQGIVAPMIVVSRGLLAAVDPLERQAILAHELAHWARGGNLRLLGVWLLRAAQAPSPGALIVFRALVEAEEAACDDLAARITGRPGALASALIKAHARAPTPDSAGTVARARAEVLRRADLASTRSRIARLLHAPAQSHPANWLVGLAVTALGLLLWSIA